MPHHSGGGSHSGGSHGSSGGHHGGSSGPVISRKPFTNSRRFRYYDRRGLEHYVYSTQMPKKMSTITLIITLIMFSPFLFGGIFIVGYLIQMFKPVEPLTPVYESSNVHIEDNIGAINNDSSLESVLKDFEDLTGISPYIITVYDSEWLDRSVDLIDYSYDLYVNHFDDEQHFLIVYSEPENADELSFVEWKWEAMQGDDTDFILTEGNFGRFQNDLQEGFTRDNVSTGEAFEAAFSNSLAYMMENNVDISNQLPAIFFALVWFTIILGSIVSVIRNFIMSRKTYEEAPMENTVGYNAGNNIGINMPGYNAGNSYGTNMTGYNAGNSYGTNMPNYNAGNSYGTNMSDYNINNGSNSDFNYQNDDQKYSQDNLKSGGGYILNGEYYDSSEKKD